MPWPELVKPLLQVCEYFSLFCVWFALAPVFSKWLAIVQLTLETTKEVFSAKCWLLSVVSRGTVVTWMAHVVLPVTCAQWSNVRLKQSTLTTLRGLYTKTMAEQVNPAAGLRVRDPGLALLWMTARWSCFLSPVAMGGQKLSCLLVTVCICDPMLQECVITIVQQWSKTCVSTRVMVLICKRRWHSLKTKLYIRTCLRICCVQVYIVEFTMNTKPDWMRRKWITTTWWNCSATVEKQIKCFDWDWQTSFIHPCLCFLFSTINALNHAKTV